MRQKSAPNARVFKWTAKRDKAAQHLAEDTLSDVQIANQVGIGRATLARWKNHPDFTDRVEAIRQRIETKILEQGIARRSERIRRLDEIWQGMLRIIRERAVDPSMKRVPGGTTGLLLRRVKRLGFRTAKDGMSKEPVSVEEYRLDTRLLRMLLAYEKQAAQELGQWGTNSEPRAQTQAGWGSKSSADASTLTRQMIDRESLSTSTDSFYPRRNRISVDADSYSDTIPEHSQTSESILQEISCCYNR